MRRRMVVGGAAAAGLAYQAGKHRGQGEAADDAQYEQYEEPAPVPYAPPPPAPPVADSGPADELARLAQLHQQGILTDEEFAQAKAKVING
jgi:hypothetical protein